MAKATDSGMTTYSPEAAQPMALKARYKQLTSSDPQQRSYQIRVHRCVSWMLRIEQITDDQPEARFLYAWIALNCLYSRWNATDNEPDRDSPSRRDWLGHLSRLDPDTITAALKRHRGLVKKVLQNPYLSQTFWRDPHHPKAKGWATEDANHLDRNMKDGHVDKVLTQVMDRLFVLRGQIIHGSSSGGSRLNRKTLNDCQRLLDSLLPVLAWVFTEHGSREKWPEVCYPPLSHAAASTAGASA